MVRGFRVPGTPAAERAPCALKHIETSAVSEILTWLAAATIIPGRWTSSWKRYLASLWPVLHFPLSPPACTESTDAARPGKGEQRPGLRRVDLRRWGILLSKTLTADRSGVGRPPLGESGSVNLSPDQLLVKCPSCGAWPMSIVTSEGGLSYGRATFRCAKCRAQEAHTVGIAGLLIPAPAGSR